MRIRRVVAGVMFVLGGLLAGPLIQAVSAQEVIYLVRHAERLDDSKDSALSADGWARAAKLAETLRDAGITAIFATQYQRTSDTARPLAARLGVPVVTVTAGQHGDLLKLVRAAGPTARVLIVGHSDTVPELLTALGYAQDIVIAKGEYDNLFVVVSGDKPVPVVLRLRY